MPQRCARARRARLSCRPARASRAKAPRIWDALRLNTAITLPIGLEAYGAYALGAWLAPGAPETARKFARRSAIGALALGMTLQVIFHLLSAAHASRASWPVVVLVSCIPVVTLGFGAALAHLLRAAESGQETPGEPEPSLEAEPAPVAHEKRSDMALRLAATALPAPVPADARRAAEASLRATLAAEIR